MAGIANLKKWRSHPVAHIFLVAMALTGFKLFSLESVSRSYLDCRWCLSSAAVVHEFRLLLLLAAVHLCSELAPWKVLRGALRLLLIALLLLVCIDLFVSHQFWVRLSSQEFLRFVGEVAALQSFLLQLFSNPGIAVSFTVGLVLLGVIFLRYVRRDSKAKRPLVLYTLTCVLWIGSWVGATPRYHDNYLKNSLEVFFAPQSQNSAYSEPFSESVPAKSPNELTCSVGLSAHQDVILVVVESLSMYQSQLFSGLHDWTPEFDAISKEGLRFSNFYANGITTEMGLVSLLAGEPPIAKGRPTARTVLEQFEDPPSSLPKALSPLGYETVFLTTGNLGFVDKGVWLKQLGFDFVEGHDAKHYFGMPRFHFDAAPDHALYSRAIGLLKQPRSRPIFLTLETVSTHLPSVDPITGIHSEESVVRYADHALGDFVRGLKSQGFFSHGTVIITGDHRAMVPMSEDESAKFGDSAYARVPFTVLGAGIRSGEEVQAFSHSDLLPSLQHWLGQGVACIGPNQGQFLPTASHTPGCVYTHRPYSPSEVFIQCKDESYQVELDGDNTRFSNSTDGPIDVLNELHRLRLGQGF
jgi:hypothetical protein